MDLSLNKQIIALIERSENILLCTHRKPDGDAVGSIMAMHKALKLMGKKVTAVCSDTLPESFDFLPEVTQVGQNIGSGRDFVVTLDCDETEVDRLKYHLEDNKIHIVITPKMGRFQEENVSFSQGDNHFDLIITVDVADIPQLGKIYDENADLFASVPVVNIDHHISNTQFGKVNLIDVASSSTAEILFGLIKDMESHFKQTLLTADTATFLLSGITTDTGSFQNSNTTPKAMGIAAELMDAGANQQDIIKYLFRTKKLETLKLYGKILSKIEVDPAHRLVWSSITQQDLKSSGADMEDAAGIIDELMVHAPEAEIIALFKEQPDMVSVSLRSTTDQADVMEIASQLGGGGHVRAAGAKISGKSLAQVSNEVLAILQKVQGARLGISDSVQSTEKEPEITQVLDGYIQPKVAPHPSLEEKAQTPVTEPVPTPNPFEKGEPDTHPTAVAPAPQKPLTPPASPEPVVTQAAEPPAPPVPPAQPPQTPSPLKGEPNTTQQTDQGRTKAAIEAEQGHPMTAEESFKPSEEALKQTPQRPQEKRFTDELPDFLKADTSVTPAEDMTPSDLRSSGASMDRQAPKPETPPAPSTPSPEDSGEPDTTSQPELKPEPPVQPPLQASEPVAPVPPVPTPASAPEVKNDDDGVSVKVAPASQAMPTPVIPEDSAEPTVKTITPPANTQDTQAVSDALSGFGGGPTPPAAPAADVADAKPEPPKDPFAMGEDGLTDIERALGGL